MQTLKYRIVFPLACFFLLAGLAPAQAQTVVPIPITAEEAFDAVQAQVDPATGIPANVVLVDVRSRAEYYWVGSAAKVTEIKLTSGALITPDFGKVKLEHGAKFLVYTKGGKYQRVLVQKVGSMKVAPIAFSVPYQLWNEDTRSMTINPAFAAEMERFAGAVVIFYCRSGGRTDGSNCVELSSPLQFPAVYEIDQPDGTTNHGGFEGSNYGNVFNGYRGFPDRDTSPQPHPSASWKDAGLPIAIGATPPSIPE